MLIKFNKIKLNNFFSFSSSEINLDDMGYTLVEGRNHCKLDNAFSNGSGKSSIFNGICYALTGETSQGVSNGIENLFSDPNNCWVELSFSVDNNEFILRRYKTPKSDLKIWVNGEDKSGKGIRESSKILADYLPDLTSTLLNSIIILGQGLPNKFTNNTPAQRKEILEKLTKSDFMIQSIKDKLDLRHQELKSNLREKEDSLLAIKSKIDVHNLNLNNYKKELALYSDTIDDDIENINNDLLSISDSILELDNNINYNRDELEKLNSNKNDLIINNKNELDKILEPLNVQIDSYKSNRDNLNTEIKILTSEINKLDLITDICPTCGQKIPGANKPDTTNMKINLKDLMNELDNISSILATKKQERDTLVDKFNSDKSVELHNIDDNIKELKNKINDLSSERNNLSNDYIKKSSELSKLNNIKSNYTKLLNDISSTETTINDLVSDSDEIDLQIINIKDHINIVQQMITLARREFRGILLLNIINYINNKVKQYSKEVFDTEELSFELNDNAIDISYCNKPYENLSGGEKQKIDIIVQLALRDILSKQLNIHSNLLVIDECFDNLDLQGCGKIINLISNLTDVDSVFIISHHVQDLGITCDTNILVEKDENGISSIKIV